MIVAMNGKTYENFSMIRVSAKLNALSRSFTIEAEMKTVNDLPFRKQQTAEIWIGEEKIFTGFIDRIEVKVQKDQRYYVITGNDKMNDLVDSNLDEFGELYYVTVSGAARAVLKQLDIEARVIDLAGTDDNEFDPAYELMSPQPEDTAYEFLYNIASRRQALLASDGEGNLLITQGIGERVSGTIVNREDGTGNALEDMNYVSDDSRRFGTYISVYQQNEAATGGNVNVVETAGGRVGIEDAQIRPTRRRTVSAEATYSLKIAKQRALWDANLRRAEGISYTAKLPKWHMPDGKLWRLNTAPVVEDEFAGIDGRMLIKGIVYVNDARGETTELEMTESGAFQASLSLNTETVF